MLTIGSCYLFHTHLGIWLGRVREIVGDEVILDQCSWMADQGRMGNCVRTGAYNESEYVGNGVIVPRQAIKVPWAHALPTQDR